MKRRLLLILIICAFYTLGTEITRTGSCPKPPTLKPVENFSLSELEGRYAALAFYSQVPSLGLVESCYRMTFTQINDNRTYVEARWKPALLYIGIPLQTRYYLEQTSDNGTFDMLDGILQLYRGEAYILSNNENITVMYTCRYTEGLIPLYSQDVLVLSQNTVYAPDDQEAVKAVLKDNELDYGFLRNVEQGREECTQILKLD